MLSFDNFRDETSKFYLSKELTWISEEEFEEQLNILPPLGWKTSGDSFPTFSRVEYFFASEMTYGSITRQYYKGNGVCLMKYADYKDQSTWISQTDIYNYKNTINDHLETIVLAFKIMVRELVAPELGVSVQTTEGLYILGSM